MIAISFEDESHTSQDYTYCGLRRRANRVHRGLYRCGNCGIQLNADVNGSINIMRKVVPKQVFKKL